MDEEKLDTPSSAEVEIEKPSESVTEAEEAIEDQKDTQYSESPL